MGFGGILAQLAQGAAQTIYITLACCATALIVGLVVAGLRRVASPLVVGLLDVYTYVYRGVPVLVMLFMVYFGLPGIGLKVSPLWAMMLSLGLIAAAYVGEVFRGALDAVDPTEILAAQASGLSRVQVLMSIELPQMLRMSVPGSDQRVHHDPEVLAVWFHRRPARDHQAGDDPDQHHAARH